MSEFRTRYVVIVVIASLLAAGIGVVSVRPDLLRLASFQKGIEALLSLMPGWGGKGDPAGSQRKGGGGSDGAQVVAPKDIYLIELKTGGRVYTDNLKTGDGKLTYETATGLVITINSHEVLGVRKFKEGEQPDR